MIGIDEVGRGAWAGPLVVAGCYFTENPGFIRGLNDSKLLSKIQREKLEVDLKSSTMFKIIIVPPKKVDQLGLTACIKQAIIKILDSMPSDMPIQLDGKYNFLKGTKYESRSRIEIKADSKYVSVMSASILAKVERDRIMKNYDKIYPGYGFASNVGYGTKFHSEILKKLGPTPIHRKSYKPVMESL